jgi:hypothetical protein
MSPFYLVTGRDSVRDYSPSKFEELLVGPEKKNFGLRVRQTTPPRKEAV